jgi:23S rRNA pseudouridine2605 synthase
MPQPSASTRTGERIAKVLARAGVCSRRDAERWIEAGRVAVNGRVLKTPAVVVGPRDRITVDGAPLPERERTRLWLYHKPKGLVTSARDPEGRPTVFKALPADMPRVVAVGRLDISTEGLLLLTNDGGLARVLELPATGWLRRYRVRAHGTVDDAALAALREGVAIDGIFYGAIDAVVDRVQGSNVWLVVGLREGKNREVKRVLESLGLKTNRLIRVSFGPFQLGDLKEGEVREVRGRVLRDQLGPALAESAGADFASPVRNVANPKDVPGSGGRKPGRASPPSRGRGRAHRRG